MLPEPSKNLVVHCDMCGHEMKESAMAGAGHSAFLCYRCNNVIYESDLWRYEGPVIRRKGYATSGD